MKVLLDECVPAKFANSLGGHDCITVPLAGLAGTKNGELLSTAEELGFELFVTIRPRHRVSAESSQSNHRNSCAAAKDQPAGGSLAYGAEVSR